MRFIQMILSRPFLLLEVFVFVLFILLLGWVWTVLNQSAFFKRIAARFRFKDEEILAKDEEKKIKSEEIK